MFKKRFSKGNALTKAFIFPFDALTSLVITGRLLDKGEVDGTTQIATIAVLGGIYLVVALIIAGVKYVTELCGICECKCSEEVKKDKNIISSLFLVLNIATVCVVVLYYVGDNFENFTTDDRGEIKKSTYMLIAALLSFELLRGFQYVIKKVQEYKEEKQKKEKQKKEKQKKEKQKEEKQQEEEQKEEEVDTKEEVEKKSRKDFCQAYVSAVIAIFALFPEYDGAYTTYLKLVDLTTGACHQTANYNVLWIVLAAVVVLLGFRIGCQCIQPVIVTYKIYIYKKSESPLTETGELLEICLRYVALTLTLFFIIIVMGLFLVSDNNLPLDCSPHLTMKSTLRTRIAFLVVAIVIYFIFAIVVVFQCCYNFYTDSWYPKCRDCSSQPTNTSVQ